MSRTSSSRWAGRFRRVRKWKPRWYFDALNFGPDHPARQMQDTFYVKGNQAKDAAGFVGSNMVLRYADFLRPGARAAYPRGSAVYRVPGRVFRTDELDATHTPVFSHQCEALAVDKHLTMADLKGVLDKLAVAMFGPRGQDPVYVRATSRSLSRAPSLTCGSRTRRAAPAGSNGAAAAWSTRTCSSPRGLTRRSTPASRSASAWSVRFCCATTSTTCTTSSKVTCASSEQFVMGE